MELRPALRVYERSEAKFAAPPPPPTKTTRVPSSQVSRFATSPPPFPQPGVQGAKTFLQSIPVVRRRASTNDPLPLPTHSHHQL
ncbi:hypothetical protein FA13DRAFT_1734652, partial [Coprinellus micaceus]